MASVHDVAAYILELGGEMSTMKLQKLAYYCQGWSLAWDEAPLFREPIQAWANGPVTRALFDNHRGQFKVSAWPWGDPANLTKDQKETIEVVLNGYGKLSGRQLSDKTHTERPWLEAREGVPVGAASTNMIDIDTMADFFSALDADN